MKTIKSILNSSFQQNSLNELVDVYSERINELRADLNEEYSNTELSKDFQDFYRQALSSSELNEYSSLNWYWLQLIEKLVYLLYLHETLEINDSDYELSDSEDELFNFWHDSEFTNTFLNMLNESKDLKAVSKFHLSMFEAQIMSSFVLHIDPSVEITNKLYFFIPEIGDSDTRLYSKLGYVDLASSKEVTITSKNGEILINNNKYEFKKVVNDPSQKDIVSSNLEIDKSLDDITNRITSALSIIKAVSPILYETYNRFTEKVVPINEPGIVSYSMQILPGYSCINTFERDFLDLLDDLLHENGHHYMNSFLNQDELVIEDDEKIYYSPWRRALRPIRGIFHAYFTFYWAYNLYSSLSNNVEMLIEDYNFSNDQVVKVYCRTVEEYYMLKACIKQLDSAYEDEKISPEGMELMNLITSELSDNSLVINSLAKLKELDASKYNEVNDFINELDEKLKHYLK